ncbi:MAG: hypothetical protein ACYC4L_13930 [Chloroflexota bacterium]
MTSQTRQESAVKRDENLLRGRGRLLAHAAWAVIAGLNMSLLALGTPIAYSYFLESGESVLGPYLRQVGVSVEFYAVFRMAVDSAVGVSFSLIGLVAFWRRPNDRMVVLVSLASLSFSTLFLPTFVRVMEAQPALTVPVALVRALGLTLSLVVFYYLLPDGRFVPRWTRWLAGLWMALAVLWLVFPESPENLVYSRNWMQRPWLAVPLYAAFYGSGIYAQVYRYRHVSGLMQRQQTKWVVFGSTAAFLGFVIYFGPLVVAPQIYQPSVARVWHLLVALPIFDALVIMAPVTLALSVLRYGLWRVDLVINRALVYGTLSALLGLLYLGSIWLLQPLFDSLVGQGLDLAVAVSTLALAATFNPLRRRLQLLFDRALFRDQQQRLREAAAFAASARDQVDVQQISDRLLAAVEQTVRPVHTSLMLLEAPVRVAPEPDEPREERP